MRYVHRGAVDAEQLNEATVVTTARGTFEAQPGDWLVRDESGVRVVPDGVFQRAFYLPRPPPNVEPEVIRYKPWTR